MARCLSGRRGSLPAPRRIFRGSGFLGARPNKVKNSPKSPEQKILGACPGKINSTLKKNSVSKIFLSDALLDRKNLIVLNMPVHWTEWEIGLENPLGLVWRQRDVFGVEGVVSWILGNVGKGVMKSLV